jgi:hypothetical protein
MPPGRPPPLHSRQSPSRSEHGDDEERQPTPNSNLDADGDEDPDPDPDPDASIARRSGRTGKSTRMHDALAVLRGPSGKGKNRCVLINSNMFIVLIVLILVISPAPQTEPLRRSPKMEGMSCPTRICPPTRYHHHPRREPASKGNPIDLPLARTRRRTWMSTETSTRTTSN